MGARHSIYTIHGLSLGNYVWGGVNGKKSREEVRLEFFLDYMFSMELEWMI